MPSLTSRMRGAIDGLLHGRRDYHRATIRRQDRANQGRREPRTYAELLQRFEGIVHTAIGVKAQGVAHTPLRVLKKRTGELGFRSQRLSSKSVRELRQRTGWMACKALNDTDDLEEITDEAHPIVSLLDRVNERDNGFDLVEDTVTGLEFAGNAYWLPIMGANGWPVEVYSLPPQHVRILPSEDDSALIGAYLYGREERAFTPYDPSQIVHFKYRNPHSPFYGFPPLAACLKEADVSIGIATFALSALHNGLAPSMIIASSKGITEEQVTQVEDQLFAKYGGEIHAGKVAVLEGMVDNIVMDGGHTNREMSFMQTERMFREFVANTFRVPIGILTLEAASLAASANSDRQLQRWALGPACRKVEDTINQSLVPMFGDLGKDVFVAFDDPRTEDAENSSEQAAALYGANIATLNEARDLAGLDALGDERGEQFLNDNAPPPSPFGSFASFPGFNDGTGNGGLSLNEPMRLDQDSGLGFREPAPLAIRSLGEALDRPVGNRAASNGHRGVGKGGAVQPWDAVWWDEWGDCCIKPPTGHTLASGRVGRHQQGLGDQDGPKNHVTKDDRAGRGVVTTERELERALSAYFERIRAPIVDSVTERGVGIPIAGSQAFLDELARVLSDPLSQRFLAEYNATAATVDMAPIGSTSARAVQFLRTTPAQVASGVLQSVGQRLNTALADGVEAGENIDQLKSRVGEVLGPDAAPHAAERIARTESAHAFIQARRSAWLDSGRVKAAEWILSSDPCPICKGIRAARGIVPVDQPFYKRGEVVQRTDGGSFAVTFRDIEGPPGHPNCRCSMGAIFK